MRLLHGRAVCRGESTSCHSEPSACRRHRTRCGFQPSGPAPVLAGTPSLRACTCPSHPEYSAFLSDRYTVRSVVWSTFAKLRSLQRHGTFPHVCSPYVPPVSPSCNRLPLDFCGPASEPALRSLLSIPNTIVAAQWQLRLPLRQLFPPRVGMVRPNTSLLPVVFFPRWGRE